jgi:hypothetical protein
MLIPNLMLAIESHADRLAKDFVADLNQNPKTPCLRRRDTEELERVARDLYAQIAKWLSETNPEEVEAKFKARARRQRKAGIPLSEIVMAVILLKKHVWEFVKRNAEVDSINDLYQRDEVMIRVAEFFDRVLYAVARGYEEGEECWADPTLFS